MSLLVVHPGWDSRIVDHGRLHCRSLGVPVGGAADRYSLAIGNALVGNDAGSAALEVTLTGPTLRAEADLACVVFGAPFELKSARQELKTGKTFTLSAGEDLHIGGTPHGLRAYLCVGGGLATTVVLGSRSGLQPVRAGDIIACSAGHIRTRFAKDAGRALADRYVLRVVPGPHSDWFTQDEFYAQEFAVSPASNRMGLRLQGMPLTLPARELVSEPVAPGAIQVTRDGQCIILGVDGQTIGGYPKIAHIIRADLDVVGQLRPGNRLRFTQVTLAEASAMDRATQARLKEWLLRVRLSLDGFAAERTLPPYSR
jgi:5-oxoprolinase (ATP-hydrolysing) subunit C